jgi:hypothetical protein
MKEPNRMETRFGRRGIRGDGVEIEAKKCQNIVIFEKLHDYTNFTSTKYG